MDPAHNATELSVFGVGLLLSFVCLPALGTWVWLNTLPLDAPTTAITFVEVDTSRNGHANSSSVTTYIEVGDVEYPCRGARTESVGHVVLYDPSTPSRCRAPERVGQLGFTRLILLVFLSGIGAMVYAVVSFFFLNGGREPQRRRR